MLANHFPSKRIVPNIVHSPYDPCRGSVMRFTPSEGNFTSSHLQGPLRACYGLLWRFFILCPQCHLYSAKTAPAVPCHTLPEESPEKLFLSPELRKKETQSPFAGFSCSWYRNCLNFPRVREIATLGSRNCHPRFEKLPLWGFPETRMNTGRTGIFKNG